MLMIKIKHSSVNLKGCCMIGVGYFLYKCIFLLSELQQVTTAVSKRVSSSVKGKVRLSVVFYCGIKRFYSSVQILARSYALLQVSLLGSILSPPALDCDLGCSTAVSKACVSYIQASARSSMAFQSSLLESLPSILVFVYNL
eukprot:IDg10588t1